MLSIVLHYINPFLRVKIMPKTVTLRIDDKLLDRLKHHANMENRSISNFIETATLRYIEETTAHTGKRKKQSTRRGFATMKGNKPK